MLRYNKKIIAHKIIVCDNLFSQGTGLMFRTRKSLDDTAWLFVFNRSQRVGVTMLFVFFPIDIVFLDKDDKIVELKESLRPFRNYMSVSKISKFIELEKGTIKKYHMKHGSKVTFDYKKS